MGAATPSRRFTQWPDRLSGAAIGCGDGARGQVGPRASRPVTRPAGRLASRTAVGAARVPGCPSGYAPLPMVAAPDNARGIIGPLARGHARLWVAARGEDVARSRVLHVGPALSSARARTRASLIPGRVFIVARSLHI